MERALIVREPWVNQILDGFKIWELRSKPTKVRGTIGIIEQGTGLIVGQVDLIDSLKPFKDEEQMRYTHSLHCVDDIELVKKWRYTWKLENAKRYEKPIPYKHPKGAVTWVRIAH